MCHRRVRLVTKLPVLSIVSWKNPPGHYLTGQKPTGNQAFLGLELGFSGGCCGGPVWGLLSGSGSWWIIINKLAAVVATSGNTTLSERTVMLLSNTWNTPVASTDTYVALRWSQLMFYCVKTATGTKMSTTMNRYKAIWQLVHCTLTTDRRAVTFGTANRGLNGWVTPNSFLLALPNTGSAGWGLRVRNPQPPASLIAPVRIVQIRYFLRK